jgi:GNAT superfamily N-acetyltransferase
MIRNYRDEHPDVYKKSPLFNTFPHFDELRRTRSTATLLGSGASDVLYDRRVTELPPGWATDVAIHELSGATVKDFGDHLVVRSPQNPRFHWGNCILVVDDHSVGDASRWLATFRQQFPSVDWTAIGLVAMPADDSAWRDAGVNLERDEALTTRVLPRLTDLPVAYEVRQVTSAADWEQTVALGIRENNNTGLYDSAPHEEFLRNQVVTRRTLCDTGRAAWFAAFDGDQLVSILGIVCCGARARYQAVGTDVAHRRRGLASHLLGVAARWAAERDCDEWVIVTEATNSAGRVYRALGFEPAAASVSAYRPPAKL